MKNVSKATICFGGEKMQPDPLGFEIHAVSNLLRRKLLEFHIPLPPGDGDDITDAQGRILRYLYYHQDQDIFQKDLEEKLCVRRSTISRFLSSMERQGLLIRQGVAQDARLKKLVLTPLAIRLHHEIEERVSQVDALIVQGLSKQEVDVFRCVMKKIKSNLS